MSAAITAETFDQVHEPSAVAAYFKTFMRNTKQFANLLMISAPKAVVPMLKAAAITGLVAAGLMVAAGHAATLGLPLLITMGLVAASAFARTVHETAHDAKLAKENAGLSTEEVKKRSEQAKKTAMTGIMLKSLAIAGIAAAAIVALHFAAPVVAPFLCCKAALLAPVVKPLAAAIGGNVATLAGLVFGKTMFATRAGLSLNGANNLLQQSLQAG